MILASITYTLFWQLNANEVEKFNVQQYIVSVDI